MDCQGRSYLVYTISVCGGRRCLPKIFGPHLSEDRKEEIVNDFEINQNLSDDIRQDLRDSIIYNDEEYFFNIINEIVYDLHENPATFINSGLGLDLEPLLIAIIKSKNYRIIESVVRMEDIDLDVDDEGVTPICAAYFFSETPEEFQTIIAILYNLNEDLESTLHTENLREAFSTPITLRVEGYYNNILDLIERYPYPVNYKEEKLEFLRDVKEANGF